MIRVTLPYHLRTLAGVASSEVQVEVPAPVCQRSILDALEDRYPALKGTIRDQTSLRRRPFVRFFACQDDLSDVDPEVEVPGPVIAGDEPFMVIGAMSGG